MNPAQLAMLSLILSVAAVVVSIVAAIGTLVAAHAARQENRVTERARVDTLDSSSTVGWAWRWDKGRWPPRLKVTNTSARHRAFDVTVYLRYVSNLGPLASETHGEVGPLSYIELLLFGSANDSPNSSEIRTLATQQRQRVVKAREVAALQPEKIGSFYFDEALRLERATTRLIVEWKNSPNGQLQEWVADPSPIGLWDIDSVPLPGRGQWPVGGDVI